MSLPADAARAAGSAPITVAELTTWASNRGGGVAVAMGDLARALGERGQVDIEAIGMGEHPDYGDSGVTTRTVRPFAGGALGLSPDFNAHLNRSSARVVHLHGLWTYPSVAATRWSAKDPARRRVVVSPHGMLERWALANAGWKKTLAAKAYQKRLWPCTSVVHALTATELEDVRRYGLTGHVAVIPNGVAPAAPRPDRPPEWRSQLPEDAHVLLFLGRIHPKKNLPALVRAFAAAGPTANLWHLVIAGWDQGGHRQELEALAASLGVTARIHFIGPQFEADKAATYHAADAVVLPSLSEGLPVAVLEAWSYGLPVLITEECNLPVGFERGAAARFVLNDDGAAAQSLAQLLGQDADARGAMGAAGAALVASMFTWDTVAQRFETLYRWVDGGCAASDTPDFVHPFAPAHRTET